MERTVAVIYKNDVKFLNVAKSDGRGKVTLEDGSEWNARTGRGWGSAKPSRFGYSYAPQLTTVENGERTVAYRAFVAGQKAKLDQFKEGAERINKALSVYYANDLEEVRAKIAAARAELDQLEAAFT